MVIVESPERFSQFLKKFETQPSLVIPILSDFHGHPAINTLSVLYVSFGDVDFVLPFDHHDAVNLPVSYIEMIRKGSARVFAVQKKALMHIMPLGRDVVDLDGLMFMETGKTVDPVTLMGPIQRHISFHYGHATRSNVYVPLMQLVAFSEAYKSIVSQYMGSSFLDTPGFVFHDTTVLSACQFMEKSGIHVDEALFGQYFGEKTHQRVRDGLVYTEYNPYTSANRVTSRFGGVNFAALDKKTGVRTTITHRYNQGGLVMLDFESFHLRLIADLIEYEAPSEPMHQYFAKQYFKTETPTPEQYDQGKQTTFAHLYGTGSGQTLEFFQLVQQYIEMLWQTINQDGVIQSESGRLLYLSHIEEPNPGKVFNYLLQLREMEVTMAAIARLAKLYNSVQSKIVLYTYDSLLIDYSYADGKDLLRETIRDLEHGGKYPIRAYCGANYNDLRNITHIVKQLKL